MGLEQWRWIISINGSRAMELDNLNQWSSSNGPGESQSIELEHWIWRISINGARTMELDNLNQWSSSNGGVTYQSMELEQWTWRISIDGARANCHMLDGGDRPAHQTRLSNPLPAHTQGSRCVLARKHVMFDGVGCPTMTTPLTLVSSARSHRVHR